MSRDIFPVGPVDNPVRYQTNNFGLERSHKQIFGHMRYGDQGGQ